AQDSAERKRRGASPDGKAAGADEAKKRDKKPRAQKASGGGLKTPVKIDLDVVRDALGRQKFFQESAARTATPGVATGLAVTGAGGDVLKELLAPRSEEHTSELQSRGHLVCRLLLEK